MKHLDEAIKALNEAVNIDGNMGEAKANCSRHCDNSEEG